MKKNSGKQESKNNLKCFAVKSNKKKLIVGSRAVIYNRCSTEKQDSLQWQEKICHTYCNQNNWTVEKCFGEKESATTDNRKQFQEMLKFCEKERISHIVIYSYDRFSRSGDISLLKELRNKGIKVHAATQSVDDQSPSGRFSQSLYLIFSAMENEQRRDRVIEGLKDKLNKGEWIGAPPTGYEKRFVTGKKEHDHDKKQCFINEKGELIRQAFEWKDKEKLSHLEILNRLKKMGLNISFKHLSRIFRNPFYCGYISHTLLDDGELVKGKHESLISEDVFLRVNGILDKNPHGWNIIREHEGMPLKASLCCIKCNRPITAGISKSKYIYYRCPTRGCKVNIPNHKLHKVFEEELCKYTFRTELLPALKAELESSYWTLYNHDNSRSKPMKEELTRLRNELEAMEFNLAVGKISAELYEKHSTVHKRKIQQIEEELEKLINDSSNFSYYLDSSLQNIGNLFNMWQLMDYKGKVRLQKLVFPDGLLYDHENGTVRTSVVNPIIAVIASYSTIIASQNEFNGKKKEDHLPSVYSTFSSSNFFWENLEKTALTLGELAEVYLYKAPSFPEEAVSVSGSTFAYPYVSNNTSIRQDAPRSVESILISQNHYSGSTMQGMM